MYLPSPPPPREHETNVLEYSNYTTKERNLLLANHLRYAVFCGCAVGSICLGEN